MDNETLFFVCVHVFSLSWMYGARQLYWRLGYEHVKKIFIELPRGGVLQTVCIDAFEKPIN
jgi:hypothetical protein